VPSVPPARPARGGEDWGGGGVFVVPGDSRARELCGLFVRGALHVVCYASVLSLGGPRS